MAIELTAKKLPLALVAMVVLESSPSGLWAGISKTNCRDNDLPALLPSIGNLIPPAPVKPSVPFNNGKYGYYETQWRLWPGVLPNHLRPSDLMPSQIGPVPTPSSGPGLPNPTPMPPAGKVMPPAPKETDAQIGPMPLQPLQESGRSRVFDTPSTRRGSENSPLSR
jgi:hypothetical protein